MIKIKLFKREEYNKLMISKDQIIGVYSLFEIFLGLLLLVSNVAVITILYIYVIKPGL